MKCDKFIVSFVSSGYRGANGFIIARNYDKSLAGYRRLFRVARKTFPKLKMDDVECLVVRDSGWCKGCPIIRFPVKHGVKRKGWTSCERIPDATY